MGTITTLRCLHWREADPSKYAIIQRMMDHNKEWRQDKEASWFVLHPVSVQ